MKAPTRLFDCLNIHIKDAPSRIMLAGKEEGVWREYTTVEVAEKVDKLSAGLLYAGISPNDFSAEGRDKIGIIARNCPEWVILDLAVQKVGAILIPVYPTVSDTDLEYILKESGVKMIFVYDESLYHKILGVQPNLPDLKEIISFKRIEGVKNWEEMQLTLTENVLDRINHISDKITSDHLATIIYTSGTTGVPKGVMLSHKNIVSNVLDSLPCFPPGENFKALSFLPLNHIFERMVSFLYLFRGTSIYFAESMETIGDNLKEVSPEMFTTVPRLLEKVYEKIMQKGEELKGIKRKLFFWAHNLATRFEINKQLGFFYNLQLALANKLVFNKWREALGGKVICIISGGAACQVRLIRIFTAAKIPIMEGYGLTETSPVISVNRFQEAGRMFGTVGPLINNVDVKIAADGEILCKGPNIMMGYYKHPELTEDVFDGVWFKTGDIGTLVDGKFLKITDRKKEVFKTSGGKFVAPLFIENKLKESPWIENVMVVGEGQKFVSALIVPSFENLKTWCKENKIDFSNRETMTKNPAIIDLYDREIAKFNPLFNHVEQIKKFELLPHEWSVDSGEMTPKLSLKRKVVLQKNKEIINRIYADDSVKATA